MKEDIQNYLPTVLFRGTPCISVNIDCTKKADQILEIPGLGECLVIVSRTIHVKRINVTNKIQRSKTTFKSSCYCNVPWDTLYFIIRFKSHSTFSSSYHFWNTFPQNNILCFIMLNSGNHVHSFHNNFLLVLFCNVIRKLFGRI